MGNTKTQNRKQQKACLEFCASVPKPQILAQTQSALPESHILDHIRWIDGAICSTYGEAVSFLEAQALPSRCMAVAVRFRKESSSMEAPMNPDGRGSSKYSQLSKKLQGRYYQPWSNSIPGNTDCRLCPMPRMRFKTGKGKRCLRNTMLLLTLARSAGRISGPLQFGICRNYRHAS